MVLLLFVVGLDTLPWQIPFEEVHHNVPNCFEIVPSALFDTQVGVDACVPCRSSQVLVLAVRDVLVRLGIPVLLPEPIVDDVDDIRFATKTDEVVVRFDIPMDVAFGMHELDSLDHLVGDHHDGFE
jgi:hypothetical protein